jgi:hypothetical protein
MVPAADLADGLGLAQADVEALVARSGPGVGRALLALIARISSLEVEISTLRTRVDGAARSLGSSPPASSALRQAGSPGPRPTVTDRNAMLEKVFESNLELWKSIEAEEESSRRRPRRSRHSREKGTQP